MVKNFVPYAKMCELSKSTMSPVSSRMGIDVDAMPRSCNSADLSNDRGLFWTLMVTVHGASSVDR